MNGAERWLCALLDELEKRSFDTAKVARACDGLAAAQSMPRSARSRRRRTIRTGLAPSTARSR